MDDDLQDRVNKAAEYLLAKGWSVIPINVATKKPATAWLEYIANPMEHSVWAEQFQGCNLGLITGAETGVVVVDCDSPASFKGWIATKPVTPMRVRTKRGMHFYYRHPGGYVKSGSHIKDDAGFEYDIKGDRSYVMFPPSYRSGHQYQVIPGEGNVCGVVLPTESLPVFDRDWRPETSTKVADDKTITDGVSYISKIVANEGSGGDKDTFRAVCKLKDSGLGQVEAFVALLEWNKTNANPPWTERQLMRKVQSVYEG